MKGKTIFLLTDSWGVVPSGTVSASPPPIGGLSWQDLAQGPPGTTIQGLWGGVHVRGDPGPPQSGHVLRRPDVVPVTLAW